MLKQVEPKEGRIKRVARIGGGVVLGAGTAYIMGASGHALLEGEIKPLEIAGVIELAGLTGFGSAYALNESFRIGTKKFIRGDDLETIHEAQDSRETIELEKELPYTLEDPVDLQE